MHSNIAILPPSTNSLHWFSLLDASLSNPLSSYEPIPKLNMPAPSTHSLVDIPPLLTQSPLEKRLNLSDLGNPIQKKVRHNPESFVHVTEIPIVDDFYTFFTGENRMARDQSFMLNDFHHNVNAKRQKRMELECYPRDENQFLNSKKRSNKDSYSHQNEEIRDCDLSDFVVPQLPAPFASRKQVHNSYEETQKLQHALQLLQQKMASSQQQEVRKEPAKLRLPSLVSEGPQGLFNVKLAGYDEMNVLNLEKSRTPEFKTNKINWNESPNSTNNSCSTSDLCESDCGAFSGDSKYDDVSISTVTSNQGKKGKRKQQDQTFIEESKPMIQIMDKASNDSTDKIQIKREFVQIVKEEDVESRKSKESRSRTKLDPNFVSKWDMGSGRRRNRWQLTQQGCLLGADESERSKNTSARLMNIPEEDLIETPIGPNYQVEITNLDKSKGRRCPKLKWDPSSLKQSTLDTYFKKLEGMLNCTINQEKAINLLLTNQNDPKKVYKNIEGREKEYKREFIIRPKRIPEAPIFGDFRVLY